MFGLAADQRPASCPSMAAKPLAKALTDSWRSATCAMSQLSASCFIFWYNRKVTPEGSIER